jgi:hypothetical protein
MHEIAQQIGFEAVMETTKPKAYPIPNFLSFYKNWHFKRLITRLTHRLQSQAVAQAAALCNQTLGLIHSSKSCLAFASSYSASNLVHGL